MKWKHSILLMSALLAVLLTGCHKEQPVKSTPVPAAAEVPAAPEVEPLPSDTETAATTTYICSTPPEPELQTPLWEHHISVSYVRDIHRNSGTVSVFQADTDAGQLRMYDILPGSCVTMGRIQKAAGEIAAYIWQTPADGRIRWYDQTTGQWQQEMLAPGRLRHSMMELTMEDGSSYLIYLPKTYRPRDNGVLEYLPEQDGALQISRLENCWQFTLLAGLPDQDCVSDFTMVQGKGSLLNWDHHFCGELWKNYTMETEGKWCYDGYYWPCPDNYTPTGENYLYRCPASYLVKSFAYAASVHPAAEYLALAMLDTLAMEQNTQGFWPTTPRSEWLYTDYGVNSNFYDTRFNTDLLEIYRVAYEQQGGDVLLEAIERYLSFFISFAERTHFTTENGGWLIPDYGPDSEKTPHCSLNHQAAEMIELYHLAELLERPELEALADRMLLAIADTKTQWVTDSGDLHYCIFPDGSLGLPDYPYLTYNDLWELQALVTEQKGAANEALQFLMEWKKLWMDGNGVTGYLTG